MAAPSGNLWFALPIRSLPLKEPSFLFTVAKQLCLHLGPAGWIWESRWPSAYLKWTWASHSQKTALFVPVSPVPGRCLGHGMCSVNVGAKWPKQGENRQTIPLWGDDQSSFLTLPWGIHTHQAFLCSSRGEQAFLEQWRPWPDSEPSTSLTGLRVSPHAVCLLPEPRSCSVHLCVCSPSTGSGQEGSSGNCVGFKLKYSCLLLNKGKF